MDAIQGLASYPFSDPALLAADGITVQSLPTDAAFPAHLLELYEGLRAQFEITRAGNGAPSVAANTDGDQQVPAGVVPDVVQLHQPAHGVRRDRRRLSLRHSPIVEAQPGPSHGNGVSWGRVVALCLRQPLLAERLGLMYRLDIDCRATTTSRTAGGLPAISPRRSRTSTSLTPATELRSYAARIPPITEKRPLFAAVLFPYVDKPGAGLGQLRRAQDRSLRLRRWVREDRPRDAAGQLESPERSVRRSARPERHRHPPRLGRRADSDLAESATAGGSVDAGKADRGAAGRVLLSRRRPQEGRTRRGTRSSARAAGRR